MATQTVSSNQIDFPANRPKRVKKNRVRSYSQSSGFNLCLHPTVPTQLLSKCSSVTASTTFSSSKHSQPGTKPEDVSWHILRQRPRMSRRVRIRKVLHIKSMKLKSKNEGSSSAASTEEDANLMVMNGDNLLNANLAHKYRPRAFADIVGHEITVKAISKAVEKMKIVSLYLFHGPAGTGKTSTARIFAMALNCKSTSSPKPCWSCRGCSRSLFIMDLCSQKRTDGLERIKTLLENTSFTSAISGFKVLILKPCHLFNAEAWDDLLGMAERAYEFRVIFVIVIADASMVPLYISSRCQKFSFPKLTKREIESKIAKIVAAEGMRIENEALRLIAAKAEGSMREAENILDQLALLGSTVHCSMVQRLVGIIPQNKLLSLLATTISGDAIRTIRYTQELLATGVQPLALVSQLASLITDTLSYSAASASSSSFVYD